MPAEVEKLLEARNRFSKMTQQLQSEKAKLQQTAVQLQNSFSGLCLNGYYS
jgi:FtsZ-binding cell division protein ZapB